MQGFEPLILRASLQAATKLCSRLRAVRAHTVSLCVDLLAAGAAAQSMREAWAAPWHLAHTTWFFETFVLVELVRGYRVINPEFAGLFNGDPGLESAAHARGWATRPGLEEIYAYRRQVDAALEGAIATMPLEVAGLVESGCRHEEGHQELLLAGLCAPPPRRSAGVPWEPARDAARDGRGGWGIAQRPPGRD
jgi:hypothetical protein